ncbi:hypothetical protein [Microbacterium ulmi]|uniref:Uncharacterized protein n=1 Tax=Microbacterium ulmi TaxID=179095 RepID=A0A7Y2LYZ9_9MICO|nr:hypothetical protein [Microbacterium ulmi]NII69671.1 hypothetical protein [Microbacterium ulmi]NNH03441.1 hypothetical protein [Microbacterium ulmi]
MSRYVYLLSTLPASVIEKAHESAFKELPAETRRETFDRLRPFMSEAERAQKAEPALLARVLRRATAEGRAQAAAGAENVPPPVGRDASGLLSSDARHPLWPLDDPSLITAVAFSFLSSQSVATYFSVGAGSIALAGEPAWVGDLGSSGSAGLDGGYGGFDGGGFGGGFDGGGFGGGGLDGGGFGGGGLDGGGGGFG